MRHAALNCNNPSDIGLRPRPYSAASSSTVPFPVDAYLRRIAACTSHVRKQLDLQRGGVQGWIQSNSEQRGGPQHVLAVIEAALFATPAARPECLALLGPQLQART
jgi:hypothetical protein